MEYFEASYLSPHHVHIYSLTQSTFGFTRCHCIRSGCSTLSRSRSRFSGLVTYDESRLVHVRWLVNKKCYCKCYTFCQSVDYILLYGTKCHPMSHISSHIIKCHNIPQGNARYGNLAGGEKDLILMTLLQNTM